MKKVLHKSYYELQFDGEIVKVYNVKYERENASEIAKKGWSTRRKNQIEKELNKPQTKELKGCKI